MAWVPVPEPVVEAVVVAAVLLAAVAAQDTVVGRVVTPAPAQNFSQGDHGQYGSVVIGRIATRFRCCSVLKT